LPLARAFSLFLGISEGRAAVFSFAENAIAHRENALFFIIKQTALLKKFRIINPSFFKGVELKFTAGLI